jgi:hypothetical protein
MAAITRVDGCFSKGLPLKNGSSKTATTNWQLGLSKVVSMLQLDSHKSPQATVSSSARPINKAIITNITSLCMTAQLPL